MRIRQQLLFLLFILLFCQNSLVAFSDSFIIFTDTIPEVTPIYKGNRIMVKSIKVIKKRGSNLKIQYNLVNTGKNKIKLGKGKIIPRDLMVTFDKSLEANDLQDAKTAIIESLKNQKISIRPGQLMMSNKMKFSYTSIPPTDRIAETKLEHKIDDISTTENKISEVETPSKEKKEIIAEKLDETILTKEINSPAETTVLEDGKNETLPSIKEDTTAFTGIENRDSISSTLTVENKPFENTEAIIEIDSISNDIKSDKNLCGDLVLQDVEVVKKNKRFVIVKYTVANVGNLPIALLGATKKLEDNIALQAHFTRSNKLTRGSIPVKLTFVKKGLKNKKGILEPHENYSSRLKIETSKMTKFTPVLALSLNPFNITSECSKLNNTAFVNIANQDAPPAADPLPIKPKLEIEEGEEVLGANN